MKIINKILGKTVHAICATADFIGVVVGTVIKWTILSALALSAMVAALLLWMSVPYFTCTTLFSEITSQWQVFAMFGIFGGWFVITKIALDRWDRGRNKSPLDKFFEELNKQA